LMIRRIGISTLSAEAVHCSSQTTAPLPLISRNVDP
jgi:hypothetical protein